MSAATEAIGRASAPRQIIDATTRQGMLLMAGSLVLILIANALARDLATRLPVGEVVFFRFLVALPVVLACSVGTGVRIFASERTRLHALRAALVVAATFALYASSQHVPFADLIAIAYSTPIFVALLAWRLIGERLSGRRICLNALGFIGVILVACPGELHFWAFGALAMAVLNAFAVLCTRSLGRSEDASAIAVQFAIFGALFAAPACALGWVTPDKSDLALLVCLGVAAGFAIHLHAHAFRRAPASILAPIDYLGIALSVGVGFFVWSEIPSAFMLAGAALIVAAGLLQFRRPR